MGFEFIKPVLVVVAPRELTNDVKTNLMEMEDGYLEKSFVQLVVIDLEGMRKLYGPSLVQKEWFFTERFLEDLELQAKLLKNKS